MANFTHPFLQKLSTHNKQQQALIYNNKSYSYGDLINRIEEKIDFLSPIPTGCVVGIVGDYDLESIATFLAGLEKRYILAPLSKNDDFTLKTKEAQMDFIIQNNSILSLESQSLKHQILENLRHQNNGLILFSSGTTGKPKAIVHNLDILLKTYEFKKPRSLNTLLFLMFDHIGGLNTLFNTLAIGSCGVAMEDRKNIELLAKNIQDYKISMLPASPSLLNLLLLSEVRKKYNLSSLKIITYGTEQMPQSLLSRLKIVFPHTRFHQTFGASETGITQTKTFQNFIKLENTEYKIKNNELYLKSSTQSLGYLNASNAVFDDEGYFATGDLVEVQTIDNEEYLKIIGRIKEIINVGGEKVLPQEIEETLYKLEGIKDCLVYGEKNAITGQSITLEVVIDTDILPAEKGDLKKIIKAHCKKYLSNYKIPTKIILKEKLALTERFKKTRLQ